MAEGDRQLAFTTGPLPVSVQVSGADKLTPKTVNASFDGTGAAGAFRPCLIITGRTGHEVARIPAPKVAAGASAEVSWFPRVAAEAAAGGGGDYVFIAEQVTDVNNQIVFASIPQTFRHLRLELSVNTTDVGTPKVGLAQVSVTDYFSDFLLFGTGSGSIHRVVDDGQTYFIPLNYGRIDGGGAEGRAFTIPTETDATYASYVIEIPYYSRTDRLKRLVWQGSQQRAGFSLYTSGGGGWATSTAAIDALSIVAYSGTVGIGTPDAIGAGSIASLYGVT